jgi:hypothetical protein
MARPSKIDRLEPEIRAEIAELRAQGRTIDEILGKLRELKVDVSRSGLGRHIQELDAIAEQIRKSRAIAEQLVQRFGDAPESRTARLNIELAQSLAMKVMMGDGASDAPVTLDAREFMFVSQGLQKLAQAAKQDVEREAAIEEKFRAKVREKAAAAAKAVERELKRVGLSDEARSRIETEILGIQR